MIKTLLNGEWNVSESKATVDIYSPSNKELVGSVPSLSQEELNTSIETTAKAQTEWAERSVQERGEILNKWADLLEERKEEIGTAIMKEVAKNKKSSVSEVERTVDYIRHTVEDAYRLNGEVKRGDGFKGGSRSKVGLAEKAPLGTILAIGPFNYPVNLSASKIAPALVQGNSVVFKPATQGAISGIKMVEALIDAGLPKELITVATGRGSVIGDFLVQHPKVDMISFTGGTATGRHIAQLSSMVPLVLELGGKDPAIVLEDADLDKAAKEIVAGAYSYSGQRCTAIKRVLVQDEVADELVDRIAHKVKSLSVGMPEDNKDVTPLIDDKSADYVQSLIDDAKDQGATVISGDTREGNLLHPTLLDHVSTDMRVAWEEPFGPVLPIIRVSSQSEAIQIANESEYGLQASIFTKNIDNAMSIADKLEVGTVQLNGKTSRGPDHFPFLGVKASGLGVQGIRESLLSVVRDKVTVINM
ncbi:MULTISPECIES: NADP-dependent glyceraldehyde-3-phosphate dehydrogenase [Pontibacillus]|uniref:NADP-dependent glyceraldehyde-3-phosphate dehydrogenase n=1 Tax=Pontibacillus chungwhensis TaxID=265426 RepID=A0ABY8V8R0_9BACI|nr:MULTISPECIES: NADP-dependent glyceraldehyde-3-phosphate dehydrogenase [Pontibacillus]MCD5323091.1 NADP-dependent glyceraldehyde-3-phosphate dehydrogenase [Pontibacillus sp. HN14]WIG00197.1 NADP-dependent glyceraldehyde-3-phosphate dehydrogenase [Pontibacillus chungwhensis]